MKIIAFIGFPLSGKSTATEVVKELGIPVVVMGDVVRDETVKRGLKLTNENLGKVANELRRKEGMDAIAKRCIPLIKQAASDKGVVVVDGIRGIAEVERFKEEFGEDFILIYIDAPSELRYKRALERQRSDDIKTVEELKARDEREISWGMDEAIKIANFTIENTDDLKSFKEIIKDLLNQLARYVEVEIETTIFPTEDEEKVVDAVKNLFPKAKIKIENGKLYAKTTDLNKFRELLRRQRILDTARTELIKGKQNDEIIVYLNKQTATISRINFCEENAILSPLKVTFKLYNVPFGRFLDYLTPQTKDGKPIEEIEVL
ncbi:hypothetical protein DRP05_09470 [Archaeoglobales archaeon]|nr:MAG: hypothetical protein DRP05_09470 [Archaeoglobales archaeon]